MTPFLRPILTILLAAAALRAGEPDTFKLGDIELPADCAALKPAPPISPEDAARNGYRHMAKIKSGFVAARMIGDKPNPDSFTGLHARLGGGEPSGIMIGKAKLLLRRHAEGLAAWDALLAADEYREPPAPTDFAGQLGADWIPSFSALREATYANLWRIRVALNESRRAEAFSDWMHLREGLAHRSARARSLVTQMMWTVLSRRVTEAAWLLHPTRAESKSLTESGCDFDAGRWRNVFVGETVFFVTGAPRTDTEIESALKMPFFIESGADGPKTVEEYKARFLPAYGTPLARARESLVEIARLSFPGMESPARYAEALKQPSPHADRWVALEKAGMAYSGIRPAVMIYLGEWNRCVARRMDRIVVALRAYAGEHAGAYPKTLDELVPVYLDSLPLDPFSGKTFSYDSERPAVWSVGADFKDNGGVGMMPPIRFDSPAPADIVACPPGAAREETPTK